MLVLARLSCVILALAAGGCRRAAAPPVLGDVPPFELVERSGASYGSAQLAGRIWVANFIFTTCPDICPALTSEMKGLETRMAADERPERVSISVDPTRDKNNIRKGTNPNSILSAINSVPLMSPLRGLVTSTDAADMAAYIANPAAAAAPAITATATSLAFGSTQVLSDIQ